MSKNKTPYGNNTPQSPHASAASRYDQHARTTTGDPREVEARVLLKAAKQFQDLQNGWDKITPVALEDALTYNRNIWMMFVDTALEDQSTERTTDLRNNIANLGMFVFKQTLDIIADPKKEKLNILVEINREIAAGLMSNLNKKPEAATGETPAPAAPASIRSDV